MIKGLVIGCFLAAVIFAGGFFYYFASGMAPVATTDPPMPFEMKLANIFLDAHIEKQHVVRSPVAADEPTFLAGADVYVQHWAACHGLPGQPPNDYAATMYPKPTQLLRGMGGAMTQHRKVTGRRLMASGSLGCPLSRPS